MNKYLKINDNEILNLTTMFDAGICKYANESGDWIVYAHFYENKARLFVGTKKECEDKFNVLLGYLENNSRDILDWSDNAR